MRTRSHFSKFKGLYEIKGPNPYFDKKNRSLNWKIDCTTLASFCCFALIDAELEATMFDDACRSIAAQRPYFDKFMGLSKDRNL